MTRHVVVLLAQISECSGDALTRVWEQCEALGRAHHLAGKMPDLLNWYRFAATACQNKGYACYLAGWSANATRLDDAKRYASTEHVGRNLANFYFVYRRRAYLKHHTNYPFQLVGYV